MSEVTGNCETFGAKAQSYIVSIFTDRSYHLKFAVRCLITMLAIAPLAISGKITVLRWDDAFFLDRATCVDRALYSLSLTGVDHCLAGMLKSPLMSLLLLPAGQVSRIDQLNVAPLMLAFVTFGLAIWLAWIAFKARMPLMAFLAATLAIWQCGPIKDADAPFLVDGFFAILVTITMLLPLLEEAEPTTSTTASIERGILWGIVATLGALSKITFGMFGLMAMSIMLGVSLYRSGLKSTLGKSSAAAVVCLIPASAFLLYGEMYIANGWRSAYGDLAQYYADDFSYWTFVRMYASAAGILYWLSCLAIFVVAVFYARYNRLRFALGLAIAAMAVGYFLMAAHSPNREDRFMWPMWIVLPVALAGGIAPRDLEPKYFSPPAFTFAFAVAALCSLPMLARFDLQKVREATELLHFIKTDHAVRVQVVSDTPEFNINTLALAQQVGWDRLSTIDIRSVVFDAMLGRPLAESEQQLREAGFVLAPWPVSVPPAPEFTNRYAERFLHLAESCGRLISSHPGTSALLFEMHSAQCGQATAETNNSRTE